MTHSAENDAPTTVPIGDLRATDIGKWIIGKGIDMPKQITAVLHHPETTAVQWYRNPVKRDAVSGMVARHDCEVTLCVIPPEKGDS